MAELKFSSVDNNKSVAAKVGDDIVISLPQNATTGFRWDRLSNTDHLADQGSHIVPAVAAPAGGSSAAAVFRYRARRAGLATITLKLWRGSGPDAAAYKFTLTLDISN
ncbi:protease inhibitor I42 family protein [Bradyrhizobium sp. HKCCYLRH3099]|uniref:protease inhibitor I42 family protein n=1 Tax=unclassified Bradyrhizobium TaxID=2631580 RepID=UPI003EB8E1A0